MPSCNKCGIELRWPQPYNQGDRPVNEDGTNHDCGKSSKPKKVYRYEGSRMGNWGITDDVYTGRDRCGACKYNNNTWCDRGRSKPCFANV